MAENINGHYSLAISLKEAAQAWAQISGRLNMHTAKQISLQNCNYPSKNANLLYQYGKGDPMNTYIMDACKRCKNIFTNSHPPIHKKLPSAGFHSLCAIRTLKRIAVSILPYAPNETRLREVLGE